MKWGQLVILVLVLWASPVFAGTPLTPEEAVALLYEHNPEVKIKGLQVDSSEAQIRGEEARFGAVLGADLQVDQSRVNGEPGEAGVQAEVGVYKPFALGTLLSASLRTDWREARTGAALVFQATQPLLQGFGEEIGASTLYTAQRNKTLSEISQEEEISAATQEVLRAYWTLWYAKRAWEIEEEGHALAQRALDEMILKVEAGDEAEVETLSLRQARVSAEERVIAAKASVAQARLSLALAIGIEPEGLEIAPKGPEIPSVPAREILLERAQARSFELRAQEVEIEEANQSLLLAEDARQWELDAIGGAQLSGQGADWGDTASQWGGQEVYSVFVGLSLSLPVDEAQKESDVVMARLALERAALRQEASLEALEHSLETARIDLEAALTRLSLTEESAALAAAQVAHLSARLEAGAATPLEVVQGLQISREAALQVTQVRLELVLADLSLRHLSGGI